MPSSVKPWALAKVANFSLISALGAWVRPGAEGEAAGLRPGDPCSAPTPEARGVPELPRGSGLRPGGGSWRGARTVERGHAEVLARAAEALGVEQGVGLVVCLHHRHLVIAAPVWEPRRQPRLVRDPWGGAPPVGWRGRGPWTPHPLSSCLPCPSPAPCFLPAQPLHSPASPNQKSWRPSKHTGSENQEFMGQPQTLQPNSSREEERFPVGRLFPGRE